MIGALPTPFHYLHPCFYVYDHVFPRLIVLSGGHTILMTTQRIKRYPDPAPGSPRRIILYCHDVCDHIYYF